MESNNTNETENTEYVLNGADKVKEKDVEKAINHSGEIEEKLKKNSFWSRIKENFHLMLDLLRDYWFKEYDQIPWKFIAAGVFALLYVLNPWDLIPDYIPFVGTIDDFSILAIVFRLIDEELQKYKAWKMKEE